MAAPSIAASVFKLALAGEQTGFTVEQMIELLNAGVTVESLLRMIERRLAWASACEPEQLGSSRCVM
jgi:hypothetical protein